MPEVPAVGVRNRSHAIIVDFTAPTDEPANGGLLALGSALGGWTLHLLDGRPRYVRNLYSKERQVVAANDPVGAGPHRIEYSFTKDEGLCGAAVR